MRMVEMISLLFRTLKTYVRKRAALQRSKGKYKKQVRKARAEHLVKCCLQPGKKTQRKPLTELQK